MMLRRLRGIFAGATLSKGLNRGLGTIMAASLGLLIDYFANFIGPDIEPFIVGCSIFLVGKIIALCACMHPFNHACIILIILSHASVIIIPP
jgi:uncharacterized membrane protein YccC